MSVDKFLIAPFDSGLNTALKPFMIPDAAFSQLKNANVFRGRIVKRFGSELTGDGATNNVNQTLYSQTAIKLDSWTPATTVCVGRTDGAGGFTGYVPDGNGIYVSQKFTIDAITYTINALGNPAALTVSGGGSTGTIDTTTGELIIVGAVANKDIIFYPFIGYSGLTDGAGVATGKVPGKKYRIGQQFSVEDVVFTVIQSGNMLRSDGSLEAATFDTTTGVYSITIAASPNKPVYFYPHDPIMGFSQYEKVPVTDQPAYAFDTQFVYNFTGGRWLQTGPAPAFYFHGSDSQFFWSSCWLGKNVGEVAMFVTNNNATNGAALPTDDPIWYFDGNIWLRFMPKVQNTGKRIVSARIILPFKRRLVMFDVTEQVGTTNTRIVYRGRFSIDGSPLQQTLTLMQGAIDDGEYAWLEPNQLNSGGGSYVDCTSQEGIIATKYLRDRLDVFFERSTWEFTYTSNEVEPFQWNKLNTELGSESTFSTVPFDKMVLTVSPSGITVCNGSNVERLDSDIPDYVFQIDNDPTGTARIFGVRDYKQEMVYWTLPINSKTPLSVFPNTILVYNYKNNTWSENDDCITAFGYFEQSKDKTWQEMTIPWEECNFPWTYYLSIAKERQILAGNHQGYIFLIKPAVTSNARVMSVTDFNYNAVTRACTVKIMDHSLRANDYIKLYDINGINFDPVDTGIHQVKVVLDKDTVILNDCVLLPVPGTYVGGGTVSRVSQVSIKTKQWNFYLKEGKNFMVNRIDFLVTKSSGHLDTSFSTNSTNIDMAQEAISTTTSLGLNPYTIDLSGRPGLLNLEQYQERVWRTIYPQADGNFIQLNLSLNDSMMKNNADAFSTLEIHGIILYCNPTGSAMEGMSYEF